MLRGRDADISVDPLAIFNVEDERIELTPRMFARADVTVGGGEWMADEVMKDEGEVAAKLRGRMDNIIRPRIAISKM